VTSVNGTILNLIEILSYILLYGYIWRHDNKNAADILHTNVIQMRNRVNAISITGLFAGWLMEAWYLLITGLLVLVYSDQGLVREVSVCLKGFEFVLVPLVQIYTSAPIKRFLKGQKTQID